MSESNPTTLATSNEANGVGQLRELYESADSFAREVSEFRTQAVIPAHNELRYAGHHLLQSLGNEGTVVDVEQLRRASSHCERAMYEAAEAGIATALDAISQFRSDFKDMEVGDLVTEYPQVLLSAKKARDVLVRQRSEKPSALDNVGDYMVVFRELRDAVEVLDANRDDLNARLSNQVRDSRRFVTRCLIWIFGIVATIAVGVWGLLRTG